MSDTAEGRPAGVVTAEPFERAGRNGHKFADGSILWDNGEREYPTSGKSDEQKRAEARALADGGPPLPHKPAVSVEEVQALEGLGRIIADPAKMMALRKANARAAAQRPPAEQRREQLAPSLNEIQSNYRSEAKRLLEREIDRLEELKTLAIAGHLAIHHNGVIATMRNPPMALHELVLETIRLADSGNPQQLLDQLHKVRAWDAGVPRVDELPFPPPDGYPAGGTAPPMPDPVSQPGTNLASQALGSGGQPTEYNPPNDPLAPPPVGPPPLPRAQGRKKR